MHHRGHRKGARQSPTPQADSLQSLPACGTPSMCVAPQQSVFIYADGRMFRLSAATLNAREVKFQSASCDRSCELWGFPVCACVSGCECLCMFVCARVAAYVCFPLRLHSYRPFSTHSCLAPPRSGAASLLRQRRLRHLPAPAFYGVRCLILYCELKSSRRD